MASILRKLSDDHLDEIHHMIRRDARTDLEIAMEAEARGQESDKLFSLGENDHAREMVVHRYRNSSTYADWLKAWENRDIAMQTAVTKTKMRYEYMTKLMRDVDASGFEHASNGLLARALTDAQSMDEDEFRSQMSAKGSVATTLRLVRDIMENKWRAQVEELRRQLLAMQGADGGGAAAGVSMAEVVDKVDKIMGLK